MISAQQADVGYIVDHRLGDRYLRIDHVQSKEQERDLGLDVATEDAQKTIRGMASGSYQAVLNAPMLEAMLSQYAPTPRFYYREGGPSPREGTR